MLVEAITKHQTVDLIFQYRIPHSYVICDDIITGS